MLSPPFVRITDSPALQADVDEVRAVVTALTQAKRTVRVDVVVSRDAYTVGPVFIDFRRRA